MAAVLGPRLSIAGILLAACLIIAGCSAPTDASPEVRDAWARATPPGAQVGAVYLSIHNAGAPDRLMKVTTAVSERAVVHQTLMHDGQMQMREAGILEVPRDATVAFEPGGTHLMLIGLKQPFREGDSVPLTLVFEHAGPVSVEARVAAIGATEAPGAGGPAR